ncbi:hypothetical protein T484DRAFT_2547806 [Baffinella frigidus]|nr:hypothetical protein T484DRAFT_2547806 [Cryptophyta sp. CCMP2293]
MFSIRTLQSWVELVSILLLIQAIRPAKSMPGFAAQCPVLSRNVLRAACLQPLAVRPSETDDVFGMVIEVDDMLPWSVKGRAPSEARFGADPRAAFTPPPENPPKPSRRPSLSPLLPSAAFIPPPDEKTLKPTKRLARNRSFSPVSPPPPRTASVSPEGNTLRYPLGVPRLVKRQRGVQPLPLSHRTTPPRALDPALTPSLAPCLCVPGSRGSLPLA